MTEMTRKWDFELYWLRGALRSSCTNYALQSQQKKRPFKTFVGDTIHIQVIHCGSSCPFAKHSKCRVLILYTVWFIQFIDLSQVTNPTLLLSPCREQRQSNTVCAGSNKTTPMHELFRKGTVLYYNASSSAIAINCRWYCHNSCITYGTDSAWCWY